MKEFEERQGIVSRTVKPGGYGFIAINEKEECFFHAKTMLNEKDFDIIKAGDVVSFIIAQTLKGQQAMRVKIIEMAGSGHAK